MTDEELIARLRATVPLAIVSYDAADRIEELAAHAETMAQIVEAYREHAKRLEEALLWCSGSADFTEGGVAREGWLKVCAPLLTGGKDE